MSAVSLCAVFCAATNPPASHPCHLRCIQANSRIALTHDCLHQGTILLRQTRNERTTLLIAMATLPFLFQAITAGQRFINDVYKVFHGANPQQDVPGVEMRLLNI